MFPVFCSCFSRWNRITWELKRPVQAYNSLKSLILHSVVSFDLTPHLTSRLSPNFSLSPPPNASVFFKPLFRNHLHRQIVRHMHKSTQTIVKVLMFLIICGAPQMIKNIRTFTIVCVDLCMCLTICLCRWFLNNGLKKTEALGGGLRLKLGLSLDVRCGVRSNETTEWRMRLLRELYACTGLFNSQVILFQREKQEQKTGNIQRVSIDTCNTKPIYIN